jgi:hypothetical protein
MESAESRASGSSQEAIDFVRFCYARRAVAWPELYDEMSVVAARGLYRGWGYDELAACGIRFTLPHLAGLAALVSSVVRTESQRAAERRAAEGRGSRRVASPEPIGAH